ncbi:hypothetical protein ANANG_G00230760 [Anguilla anguilla]|uniref:CD3e molecule, epsilon associated protein n=1 Tax=Anguilla anguilla TaxID=7936 RepID=A0A9D3LTC5_ANGAN|nr:hypothetical protein ANANG_G00230760 [Anguilla anguilla]
MAAKPREVSSSDAESDSESELVQEKQTRQRQHTKYQCPADFVFCDIRPCASTRLENVKDSDTELWLIKAPASFSPDSQRAGGTLCAPAFSGIINICESYGDRRGHQVPMAIPRAPPLIPEGLKQRFQPFGSRTLPGQGSEAGGPQEEGPAEGPAAAKRMRTDPEESAAPKKKKKKKKKKDNDAVVAKEEMVEEEVSGGRAMVDQTHPRSLPKSLPQGRKRWRRRRRKRRARIETEERWKRVAEAWRRV